VGVEKAVRKVGDDVKEGVGQGNRFGRIGGRGRPLKNTVRAQKRKTLGMLLKASTQVLAGPEARTRGRKGVKKKETKLLVQRKN